MSGSRCKALKRQFKKQFGRVPTVVRIADNADSGLLYKEKNNPMATPFRAVSEWRRVKRNYYNDRTNLRRM